MRKISEILCCVAILCCALSACSDKPATVKVSSFNIWLNTLGGKLPPSQTAKVIEASQTDIVGIQEGHIYEEDGIKHDHVPEIAESLGFHLFNQGEGHYILSRYPVVDSTASRYGVKIPTEVDAYKARLLGALGRYSERTTDASARDLVFRIMRLIENTD